MRILYLAHRIPYPPNKGDKIRSYHHLRHLARQHEVHLLCFVDEPTASFAGWETLRSVCASVELVPLHKRAALWRGALSLLRGRSLSEGYFGAAAMYRAIRERRATVAFDLAWAFSSTMAPYLVASGAPRTVVDFVDVDSEKWRQYGQDSRGLLAWAYGLEAQRMRAFERRMSRTTDALLFVSADEARLFTSFATGAVVGVVPNGVDTGYFTPTAPLSGAVPSAAPILLFTGALDYRPNVEAVRFAAREILPLVRREFPTAQLLAVGHRPAPELLQEAARPGSGLQVAGSVPDIRPYFGRASVYVAPLRLGRGVQNKILEAMAMRVPVVATPVALTGIAARAGEHALACGSAAEFSAAICALLGSTERRQALSDAAAQLIKEHYEWPANLRLLEQWIAPPLLHTGATPIVEASAPALEQAATCSHA